LDQRGVGIFASSAAKESELSENAVTTLSHKTHTRLRTCPRLADNNSIWPIDAQRAILRPPRFPIQQFQFAAVEIAF
jgi:hypothetical protein